MHNYARDQYDDDDSDDEMLREPTAEQLHALDMELVDRLLRVGGSATIAKLFDNWRPTWAVLAAGRCDDWGLIAVEGDKRLVVTPAGRAAHVEYERERNRLNLESLRRETARKA